MNVHQTLLSYMLRTPRWKASFTYFGHRMGSPYRFRAGSLTRAREKALQHCVTALGDHYDVDAVGMIMHPKHPIPEDMRPNYYEMELKWDSDIPNWGEITYCVYGGSEQEAIGYAMEMYRHKPGLRILETRAYQQ